MEPRLSSVGALREEWASVSLAVKMERILFNGAISYPLQYSWASLVAQLVKNPPVMWETWVRSLGWEDPLEKRKTAHSSILAWRVP